MIRYLPLGRSYTLEEGMEHTSEEITKDSPLDATVTTWCLLWTLPPSLPPLEESYQPQWMSPPGAAFDILHPSQDVVT